MRRMRLLGGAGAAAVLVLVAVAVDAGAADDGVDLGSWTPAPATLAVDGTTGAAHRCASAATDAETVLAEQRGSFRLLVSVDHAHVRSCLLAGDAVVASVVGPPATAPGPGSAGVSVLGYAGAAVDRDHVTVTYGYAGGDVDAVVVARPDGLDVEATVTDGWWVAWWPGVPEDDAVLRVLGPEPASTPLVQAYRRSQAQ
ncbi:hypothetical protein [Puerhibacterium sp. TATVAM-FAB25]|uniref:hypothetical protein n=1 Tax=Puerhibacterium sp. TATVAM-FAB25 TaxID=3093699 RepID=UPI00397A09A1